MTQETYAQAIERLTDRLKFMSDTDSRDIYLVINGLAAMVEKQRKHIEDIIFHTTKRGYVEDKYICNRMWLSAQQALTDCDLNKPMEK